MNKSLFLELYRLCAIVYWYWHCSVREGRGSNVCWSMAVLYKSSQLFFLGILKVRCFVFLSQEKLEAWILMRMISARPKKMYLQIQPKGHRNVCLRLWSKIGWYYAQVAENQKARKGYCLMRLDWAMGFPREGFSVRPAMELRLITEGNNQKD